LVLAPTNDNGNLYSSDFSFLIIAKFILIIEAKIFYDRLNDQKLQQYREKQKSLYTLLSGIFESLDKIAAKIRAAKQMVLESDQQNTLDT
jgi:hypothetical protein